MMEKQFSPAILYFMLDLFLKHLRQPLNLAGTNIWASIDGLWSQQLKQCTFEWISLFLKKSKIATQAEFEVSANQKTPIPIVFSKEFR